MTEPASLLLLIGAGIVGWRGHPSRSQVSVRQVLEKHLQWPHLDAIAGLEPLGPEVEQVPPASPARATHLSPVGQKNARWLHCAMHTAQPPDPVAVNDVARATLRQLAATLAYRAAKVLRDVPPGFAETTAGPATRRPVQIVAHMADLMIWGVSIAAGGHEWRRGGSDDWNREVARFFDGLAALDAALAAEGPFTGSIDTLIQGPLADALTHVGQLALLRGLAGAPVRPESYARAAIEVGRVGLEQAAPALEFDGDASAKRP